MKSSMPMTRYDCQSRGFLLRAAVLVVFLPLFACSSKQAKDDTIQNGQPLGPKISSEPINFAVQGSDTQKISGLSTIHFEYDSSSVPKSELGLLAQNAAWIKAHPNVKMQIEGNCDSRGSQEYNLALGERRAMVVYHALLARGVAKTRMTTISYGKERPLNSGDTEEAYAQNRRANFVPLGFPANSLSSNN